MTFPGYRSRPYHLTPRTLLAAAVIACAPQASAQTAPAAGATPPGTAIALDEYVVSVARLPQEAAVLPIPVRIIPGERLAAAPTIDTALRDDPAFSLFRRNTSLSANPTAQGVSLRGVGPSGASRTAVLLDEIPLNDPFGGWITWGQLPSLSLAGAEIAHGGGSGIWGSAALGGTVALASAPLDDAAGAASLQAGGDGFWRGEITHTARVGRDSVRIDARGERFGGFHALRGADRGAVDRPLDHRHWLGQLTWRHPLPSEIDASLTLRGFREDRGNGTVLQENATRLAHAAFALEGRDGAEPVWKAAGWVQRQEYSSFFTAVAPDRMSETPANDQYAVPSTAAGFQAHRLLRAGEANTVIGVDGRWVDGETRENYLYREGAFAQRRFAGGAQRAAGIFAHHDRPLGGAWHLSAALRADTWANVDGHVRERTIADGTLTRDERHGTRDGATVSPRLGVSIDLAQDTRLRAAVYRAFRLPTLNEYYRPFRVGNTTTLANPQLDEETLHGLDLALEQRWGDLRMSVGLFWNEMRDAVGNVTLSSGPAGTTRQRQNIEATRVRGLEWAATWAPTAQLELRAAALVVDAEITRARAQPALVGRDVAQVPEYAFTGAAVWRATPDTRFTAQVRVTGRQFEDDENLLPLASACVVGLRVDHRLAPATTCFVEVHDLFDQPAQTSRSAAGLITYDQPRTVRAGLGLRW